MTKNLFLVNKSLINTYHSYIRIGSYQEIQFINIASSFPDLGAKTFWRETFWRENIFGAQIFLARKYLARNILARFLGLRSCNLLLVNLSKFL